MHQQVKEFTDQQKINNVKRNPFNSKINKESLENATKAKEKKMRAQGNTLIAETGNNYYYDDMGDYDNNNGMDLLDDGSAAADLHAKLEMEQ